VHTPAGRSGPAGRGWTLHGAEGEVDVEITASDDDRLSAVLPALRAALGVSIDGLWAGSARLPDHLSMRAEELRHGAVLGLDRPGPRGPHDNRTSALQLAVVGGPASGRRVPLGRGRHVVGRGAEADIRLDDPDVSRRHLEIRVSGGSVSARDLGSTNGSTLEDAELDDLPVLWPSGSALRLGGTTLVLDGPSGAPARVDPGTDGRCRLHPPPRLTAPAVEAEVVLPAPPAPPQPRRLIWAAVALPALGGVLLAMLLRTPTFLFFALLSPVVALGTWWSERWSGRRTRRRDEVRYAAELAAAEIRVADAVRAFARTASDHAPDLATLTAATRRRTSLLWSRRPLHDDALTVRLGTGPGVTGVLRQHPDGHRLPEHADHLPVTVDLRDSGGLVVAGPRERALGVLRSVVCQLAALHPPGTVDLLLLVDGARRQDWRWTRWLPHLPAGGVALLSGEPHGARDLEERVRASLAAALGRLRINSGAPAVAPSSWQIVVLDGTVSAAIARALRDARPAGVVVLAHDGSLEAAPAEADAVLRLCGETGDRGVLLQHGHADRSGVTVDRLGQDLAAELVRDLAALEPATSATMLPTRVRLLALERTGICIGPAERPARRWSRARDSLVAPLGRGPDGTFSVDLCRHGPHALVAGTTGSGKSELLQSLIAGLALQHPPDRCSFLLIDYKGGAAFAQAAVLPHTVGMLTDLDGQTTARALRSLTAELVRREEVLARHGVADVAALPEDVGLARLVIVVDEFATLAEELPSFVPGLVGIAQRGRSLGVHLVLATQRPGGVVSPEIRANCTLRICLRTTDEADSRDVLGSPAAAHLPVDLPGRAYVRSGAGPPVPIQVARVSQPAPPTGRAEPRARLRTWPPTLVGHDPSEADGVSDLAVVARVLTALAEEHRISAPHRPWQQPLPEFVPSARLQTGGVRPSEELTVGLLDRPELQAQEPLTLDLRDGGGWLAVGGPRSGRTTLLRTVLRQAVGRCSPERLHVHVVDLAGGSLAAEARELPHTGTAIGREARRRGGPTARGQLRSLGRSPRPAAGRRLRSPQRAARRQRSRARLGHIPPVGPRRRSGGRHLRAHRRPGCARWSTRRRRRQAAGAATG
jgi:DNA segregation ATPase FtsK/SpoIIIE, S-DNA-T family